MLGLSAAETGNADDISAIEGMARTDRRPAAGCRDDDIIDRGVRAEVRRAAGGGIGGAAVQVKAWAELVTASIVTTTITKSAKSAWFSAPDTKRFGLNPRESRPPLREVFEPRGRRA